MAGELFERNRSEVAPGAVWVPGWLGESEQIELLARCREWARPPAGMRTVRTPGGGTMSAQQVSLGWHWLPYKYTERAVDGDGAEVKPFPPLLGELAERALAAAYGGHSDLAGPQSYDIGLINFYDADARMGMHRDSDERSTAPVVSFSLGDSCRFRFGNPDTRGRPYTDVTLASGDLFVFGGPSRLAYHGVPKVFPGTGPAWLDLEGRVNVTLRVSGFRAPENE
ncbi:alpha-ketoglutarate-dependent dioxygenase AlkB [Glycomyces albus]